MNSERFTLEEERIREIPGEQAESGLAPAFAEYFGRMAEQICLFIDEYRYFSREEALAEALEDLQRHNRRLYEDILPENYGESYANPEYAAQKLGEEFGPLFSFLTYELRSMIPYLFQQEEDLVLIRMELFLEVYSAFLQEEGMPSLRAIKEILYSYVSDYAEDQEDYQIRTKLTDTDPVAYSIIMDSDLADPRYLFQYGEYITDNQLLTASHLASLDDEVISKMADTFSEGYRKGFEVTGKDLDSKRQVEILFPLGFERMVRRAIHNFEEMGKACTFVRDIETVFRILPSGRSGWAGEEANPQYKYDHREDLALFLDDELLNRKLEALQAAYKAHHDLTVLHGGPAIIETFGEKPFAPVTTPHKAKYDKLQQKYITKSRRLSRQYYNEAVIGRNRSFTIISFPVPEIAGELPDREAFLKRYEEIFDAIIKINTLDYEKYQRIQQTMIDALDEADRVHIVGCGKNRTDLTVNLWKLTDPAHQTIFENCVADVNIPVGEVFTSPVLEGTNGVLHVTEVYLEGLLFKDLSLTFKDGRITDYSCGDEGAYEEGRAYIEENILFHHETLPMGECAIGTNTTAYAAGKKYGISGQLPILIAEKTGPHFAVGDTCYSDDEDNIVYNPDGKEIVAKENEYSLLRTTDPAKAYFGCHTDITIPYDELGLYEAVKADGTAVKIIENGRFVLPGTEELNEPLDELK